MAADGPLVDVAVDPAAHTTSPLAWRPALDADLARLEATLQSSAVAVDDSLSEIAGHLMPAGGKRLRPSFVIASALDDSTAMDDLAADVIQAAVSVELVHLGSLYHDDVIDAAETRRGIETVNHRWGNLQAILAGDFLLARASELAAALSTEIAELLAETIGWLCEGQIRELMALGNVGRTRESYLQAISGKTATLFATSCRIGGLVGGRDRADIDRLDAFGRSYGVAFQIMDDVADIVGSANALGKPVSTDIGSGVYTLPVIAHLELVDDDLATLLGDGSPEAAERANALVGDGPGIEVALDVAKTHITEALDQLEGLGDGAAVQGMRDAASGLVTP